MFILYNYLLMILVVVPWFLQLRIEGTPGDVEAERCCKGSSFAAPERRRTGENPLYPVLAAYGPFKGERFGATKYVQVPWLQHTYAY